MENKKKSNEEVDYSDSPLYKETEYVEEKTKMKIPTEEAVEELKEDVDSRHL